MADNSTQKESSRYGAKPRTTRSRERTLIGEGKPPVPFNKRMRFIRRSLFVSLLITLIMLVLLFSAPIEQAYYGIGHVIPEKEMDLYAQADSIVSEILVDEGNKVKKGQVLIRFDLPDLGQEIFDTKETLQNLKADLNYQNSRLSRLEKLPLPSELWEINDQMEEKKVAMEFHASQLERLKKLVEEGVVSQQEVEKEEMLYQQEKIQYNRLKQRFDLIKEGYTDALIAEANAEVEKIVTRIKGTEERLAYLEEKLASLSTLKAPDEGSILEVFCDEKETVTGGRKLIYMNLGPGRIVRVSGGERNIDLVRKGQPVRFKSRMYDSLFSETATGRVVEVSEIRTYDELSERAATAPRTYLIYCTIENEPQELKMHSTVDAQIILQKEILFKALFGIYSRKSPRDEL